jgi:hypothetical protein
MIRLAVWSFAAGLVAFGTSPVSAQSVVQVGTLACKLAPTVGLVVGSRQRMTCQFTNATTGRRETYSGTIGRLGLDIGVSAGGAMLWGVRARSANLAPRALAGTYGGASGDLALGVGVGANVLVGGSQRSVVLQPLSVEGSVGVNLALGIASLRLQ